jgi:hypothetical protein
MALTTRMFKAVMAMMLTLALFPLMPQYACAEGTTSSSSGDASTIGIADTATDISTATVTSIADQTYTGSASTPEPTVAVGGVTLTKDTDYTLSYTDNTTVGTAAVVITGMGSYTGTLTETFRITAADISSATFSVTDVSYTGSAVTPTTTVTLNVTTLTAGTDYTVAYADASGTVVTNPTAIGSYTATITGCGDYAGTLTGSFDVVATVTYASYSLGAYRDASYGDPPNGVASTDGCYVKIVFTFSDTVAITDATALAASLGYSGSVYGSTSPLTATYTASGNQLIVDIPITYMPGGVFTITPTNSSGLLEGITVGGSSAEIQTLKTVVPSGLAFSAVSITPGTSTTPATTTYTITQSANVRSMNHIIWLSNGSSIITTATGDCTQTTPAHHHTYYSFTFENSVSAIVNNASSTLSTYGYTVTDNGDGTFTLTAATAKDGEVLTAATYDDDFLQANKLSVGEAVTSASYPTSLDAATVATSDEIYSGAAITPTTTVMLGTTTLTAGTDYTVVYTDASGTTVTSLTVAGTYTATITGCGSYCGTASATFTVASYSDIDTSAWYVTDGWLSYVFENGLMSGYSGTSDFGPYDDITRGQVAVILYRYACSQDATLAAAYGSTTDSSAYATSASFSDEETDRYYTAAINWAQANDIMTGDSSTGYTTVRPDDAITREDLCTMVYRYVESVSTTVATQNGTVDYSSVQGIDDSDSWALASVEWCASWGIVGGVEQSDGSYSMDPTDTAWRASMAKIVTVTLRDVLN